MQSFASDNWPSRAVIRLNEYAENLINLKKIRLLSCNHDVTLWNSRINHLLLVRQVYVSIFLFSVTYAIFRNVYTLSLKKNYDPLFIPDHSLGVMKIYYYI